MEVKAAFLQKRSFQEPRFTLVLFPKVICIEKSVHRDVVASSRRGGHISHKCESMYEFYDFTMSLKGSEGPPRQVT